MDMVNVVRGLFVGLVFLFGSPRGLVGQEPIPFDSIRWDLTQAEVVEVGGRTALQGGAILKDVEFRDGVIEYDLYLTGARSYPGVYFRMTEENDAEHFYVRPHRAGLYPDALQYTPVVAGIAEWQFYNGPGYTASWEPVEGEWLRVRLEVQGRQARVFVGTGSEPALVIPYLEGHSDSGALALDGPRNGTAYFADFRVQTGVGLHFEPSEPRSPPAGVIKEWEVSQAIPLDRVQRGSYPNSFSLFRTDWMPLEADERGLVDIADRTPRENQAGDLAIARHVFHAQEHGEVNLNLGYSDEIDLFVNGRRVFSGASRYQGRDPSFLGIVGLHDQIPIQVRKGLNEILVMVTEHFGGWGFMIQANEELAPKPTAHAETEEVWVTADVFLTPESVLKDPQRDILYVTNFDTDFARKPEPSGFISRLSPDGEVLDLHWVEGLMAPCGMDIWQDTLFVAERRHLLAVDLATGTVAGRWEIPEADFPNDVVIDDQGTVYISDTRSRNPTDSRIYRFKDGTFDVFVNEGVEQANGIWIHDDWLLIGNSGDGMMKAAELATGKMRSVLSFGAGILDGIRVDEDGNLLVSQWNGRLYRMTPEGGLTEILNSESQGWNTADFEYLPEEKLLVIPTFFENRVRAVRIQDDGQ
jgi:hypothetical protein